MVRPGQPAVRNPQHAALWGHRASRHPSEHRYRISRGPGIAFMCRSLARLPPGVTSSSATTLAVSATACRRQVLRRTTCIRRMRWTMYARPSPWSESRRPAAESFWRVFARELACVLCGARRTGSRCHFFREPAPLLRDGRAKNHANVRYQAGFYRSALRDPARWRKRFGGRPPMETSSALLSST